MRRGSGDKRFKQILLVEVLENGVALLGLDVAGRLWASELTTQPHGQYLSARWIPVTEEPLDDYPTTGS